MRQENSKADSRAAAGALMAEVTARLEDLIELSVVCHDGRGAASRLLTRLSEVAALVEAYEVLRRTR